jgi:hypothetical protein
MAMPPANKNLDGAFAFSKKNWGKSASFDGSSSADSIRKWNSPSGAERTVEN